MSLSKAPKTQQICHYKHARKTSELFLLFNTGVNFSSRNSFANLGSFAKISVPVGSITPSLTRIRKFGWKSSQRLYLQKSDCLKYGKKIPTYTEAAGSIMIGPWRAITIWFCTSHLTQWPFETSAIVHFTFC